MICVAPIFPAEKERQDLWLAWLRRLCGIMPSGHETTNIIYLYIYFIILNSPSILIPARGWRTGVFTTLLTSFYSREAFICTLSAAKHRWHAFHVMLNGVLLLSVLKTWQEMNTYYYLIFTGMRTHLWTKPSSCNAFTAVVKYILNE